jgi:hypothetical protein
MSYSAKLQFGPSSKTTLRVPTSSNDKKLVVEVNNNDVAAFYDSGCVLGVTGDIDITGCYKVNGVPIGISMANVGVTGANVFKQMDNKTYELRGIVAGAGLTLEEDDKNIVLNFDEFENPLNHFNLLNIGSNTHAQIDNHIASTGNPHNVTLNQITPTTNKGDIIVEDGIGVVSFPVGNNNEILIADSSTSTGLKWGTIGAGINHAQLLGVSGTINDHTAIDAHIANTSNPHSVTIDQITPTTTKGDILVENGSNVISFPIGITGQVLCVDTCLEWCDLGTLTGAGEANTMSNIGITGGDIFFQKSGIDFELRGIVAGNNLTLTQDQQNIILNVDTSTIDHNDLLNIGTNTHSQIDTHIASTSNPHSVTIDQITPTCRKWF